MAEGDPEFVGVPWRDWRDTQTDLLRFGLAAFIALTLAVLTLLALIRKGVLSAADLYPLARA